MESLHAVPIPACNGSARGWAGLRARLSDRLGGDFRQSIVHYCQIMAGSVGRVVLQAAYFFLLVNALSLRGMGAFASASAVGLMLSGFSGLGFGSLAFRAAASRKQLVGYYLAMAYVCMAAFLPLGLLIALPLYAGLFSNMMPLWAFLGIIAVEIFAWRIIDLIQQINGGLGRFSTASLVITLGSLARTLAAGAFALWHDGDVEQWAVFYVVANFSAMAVIWVFYHPRIPLRWRTRLFRSRFRDSVAFALSYFSFSAQIQLDKLIVLSLTDAYLAGIYAVATRIIDFTAVPFRSFYVLYVRKLIAEVRPANLIRRALGVEAIIAVASTLGFGAIVGALWLWPTLLGHNVAEAAPFFGLLLAVPAFRNLLEFHGELFFVTGRMTTRAFVALGLIALNAGALALLLTTSKTLADFGLWLNAVYAVLYLLSAAAVYHFVTRRGRP